jgi:Predicted transcriptional regulators
MTTTAAWDSVPEFTIGDYLRKAREHAGLEQAELARDIGISRQTVTNYEKGYVRPRKATVMAWAMRCGVPPTWILSKGAESPRPEDPNGGTVRHQGLEPRTRWFGARIVDISSRIAA